MAFVPLGGGPVRKPNAVDTNARHHAVPNELPHPIPVDAGQFGRVGHRNEFGGVDFHCLRLLPRVAAGQRRPVGLGAGPEVARGRDVAAEDRRVVVVAIRDPRPGGVAQMNGPAAPVL